MNQNYLFKCLFFLLCFFQMASAQNLVFTEIMYNDPRPNTDKLEFLEIYNHDNVPINLSGYSLNGVTFTFPDTIIYPNQYFVVAVDKDTFNTIFGFQPFEWASGSLLNTGETVKLLNASGGLVDSVKYSSTGGWNPQANGFGPSLILCDVNSDNNLAASWDTSTTFVTVYYGKGLKASPGVGESCITDLQAPVATYAKATSYTEIKVAFDEAVSNATATNISNYNISLGISNISQTSPDTVLLTLANPLVLGQSMYLTINNVADVAGNVMAAAQTFQVGLGGIGGNLIITEIMYNDAGAGNDQLEFIEIYNDENVPRNLMGYSLVGVNYVFPDTILAPYSTIIVAVNDSVFNATFSMPALAWTSGSLANTGETVKLLDALNNTIDSVTYDYQMPWSPLASGLGHSLMLCNLTTDNSLASAWNPSAAYQGVYAGADVYSSPYALEACPLGDTLPPNFVQVSFLSAGELLLRFDEPIDTNSLVWANFNANPMLSMITLAFGQTQDSVFITLDVPATPCLAYDITVANLSDLVGNVMPVAQTLSASFCPDEGKIVITEIMYNNPGTDHLEFIEIYNADVKPINMKDFSFNSGITYTFLDTTMYPGEYWVIAAKPDSIMQYMNVSSFQFTGSLLNTGELLQLTNILGTVIDSVRYKNTAPWNNDANGTGPSLVLCNATLDNGIAANWSVATEYAGIYTDTLYATPKAPCSGAPLTYIPLNDTTICASAGTLDAGNSGSNFLWSTGETTQSITVTANGTYWVAVNNGVNFDTDTLTVIFAPTFTPDVTIPDSACLGQPETFEDATVGASTWYWDFGDTNTSTSQVMNHIYTAVGAYPVSLAVSNGTCSAQVIQTIYVKDCSIGIENGNSFINLAQISPNPFTDELRIDLLRNTPQNLELSITDISGKLLYQKQLHENLAIDTKSFAKGMYFVSLSKENTRQTWKIVKE